MDKVKARAFMDQMVTTLNAGSLSLMLSIGHRTGLFDTMAGKGPLTSEQLADESGLNERYVREWLSAMAMGRVVEYDADAKTFVLPEEHQMLVTRAGGPLNLAASMQNVALMGIVEDDVVDSFTTGAGVPYSRFPAFGALMAEESRARFDATLIDLTIPNIPGAIDALTAGASLADVGCGQGYALLLLAEAFPTSTFVGYDFSADAVAEGNRAAAERGLGNASFVERDAAELGVTEEYDFVTTFDAIHDQAYPKQVLAGINEMLKPGGHYLCVEPKGETALEDNFDDPIAAYKYTMSTMHCMSVSIAGGGEGLGTVWGRQQIVEYLTDAGFVDITEAEVKPDRTNVHYVSRKP